MKRLLEHNESTGLTQYFHYDETADTYTIETVADSDPVLEENKRRYNSPVKRGDFHLVASIPPEIIVKWRAEYGVEIENKDHWPRVKRLLNDSEWRYLRTAPGVI